MVLTGKVVLTPACCLSNSITVRPPAAAAAAAAAVLPAFAAIISRALPAEPNVDWVLATSYYGEDFVAAVCKGNAMATQFHPEKSGTTGK
jgi:imidazoleglycerol phosphate synthase glutamine amidotransferase subunit HisH